jgi:hypothetical protein
MKRFLTLTATILLLLATPASAYTIHGPDSDGRYATIRNVIAYHPRIEAALPATLEIVIRDWSFNGGAKTTIQESDGHIRIDIGNTLMNPAFSGLIAHELGHVIEISHPGLMTAWQQMEISHGHGPETWTTAGVDWYHCPSESFAENYRRGLYWPYFSDLSTPRTNLGWFSRVEMRAFLGGGGSDEF